MGLKAKVEYTGDEQLVIGGERFAPHPPFKVKLVEESFFKETLEGSPLFEFIAYNEDGEYIEQKEIESTKSIGVLVPNQVRRYERRWKNIFDLIQSFDVMEIDRHANFQIWKNSIQQAGVLWTDGSIFDENQLDFIRKDGTPLIVTLRGLFWNSDVSSSFKKRLWELLDLADKIVTLSTRAKDRLSVQKGSYNDKVCVIPNGIPEGDYPSAFSFNTSSNLKLLTVTNFRFPQKEKALVDMIKNLDRGYELTIYGSGTPKETTKRMFDSLSWINFGGQVSHDKVVSEMLNSHIFLYPSYKDCQPSVLMESLACGLPVIASRGMGFSEFVEDGVTGYVKSIADFQDYVDLLNKKRDWLEELSRNAYQKTWCKYNWERITEKYEEVFSELWQKLQ